MALQKTINLPTGDTGSYIRLSAYRWDRTVREASAIFSLFKDASTAAQANAEPQRPVFAKLRLTAGKFDDYLGNAALADADVLEQLYLAAKAEPVISDFGADVMSDATDA